MEAQPNSMLDSSVSAAGHRRASDTNPFDRPSEAGVPCDEGAGPGARAASDRRPRRPVGRGVRLVREVRVVGVERRRVLRRIAQEMRNRQSDELELLASPLHLPSDEEGGASPPNAPSMGEDPVEDAVPEANEEAHPRRRRYPSEMDEVNPEWLRWQYPELPSTPEADTTDEEERMLTSSEDEEEWRSSTSPAISDDEEAMPWPQETPEPEVITISDEEEDTGEERWSSPSPVVSDDEETMPWPPGTPEPEVIVISDEEEEEEQPDDGGEAQGQGERPQIPPPTVTATYARAFADGRWRHQVTLVCVWEEEAGVPPTWQLEEEHPPASPNPPQRQRSPTPPAARSPPPPPPEWRPPFLRQTSCPEAGPRPTRPTLQRQSSAPEGEAGWQELPPPAWPPGITAMADAQPGPSRRASRITMAGASKRAVEKYQKITPPKDHATKDHATEVQSRQKVASHGL
ncbi:serine/arginine repetitive matrix protein 1-like [Drosophila grimshawi]|uniref:serine/arginine repetitive matrix protein 1-like n=1 Tax=Drosophila grimshawi TaxID=7222 RepID=UPI001C932D4F|nr:serine/arginine repetitive matrix protein 1-like [Drosophila grimshawi]